MPILNIYSKEGSKLETYNFEGSLLGWIKDNVDEYRDTTRPPYSAVLNGLPWPYDLHGDDLKEGDAVDLTISPKNPLVVQVVIAIVSAAYAYHVASNLDDYQDNKADRQSIYSANTRANSAKPSGVIRELAGQMQVYPDLINPISRRYENHDEFLYMLLSVCRGHIDLREENVYIADTPIKNYEGDYDLAIYEPGDTITHEAYKNWYQTKEVADLKLTTQSTPKYGVWTASYSGSTITSYLDGTAEEFPFSLGEKFKITSGSNQGYYQVASIGSPNTSATVTDIERSSGANARLEAMHRASTAEVAFGSVSRGLSHVTSVRGSVIRSNFETIGSSTLTTTSPEEESIDWESVIGGVNWEGPFNLIPENETTQYTEIDVFFSQGLTSLDGDNENIDLSVEIEVQWRESGTDSWTTVSESPTTTTFTDATYNQRGYTITVDYGSAIRPEMRFRRVTHESSDIGDADTVSIKRVKSLLTSKTSYQDITVLSLKIRGTNALARTSENRINIRGAKRKLPTLAELEAGSWDLSNSTTRTTTYYNIVGASILSSNEVTGLDSPDYPANPSNELGVDVTPDGLNFMFYENQAIKIYTAADALVLSDLTYRGYIFAGVEEASSARFAGSGTKFYYIYKPKSPATDHAVGQGAVTIPASGAISSSIDSVYNTNIQDIVSLAVKDDGTKFWTAKNTGVIYEYTMSSAHDLGTTVTPSPLVVFDVTGDLGAITLRGIYLANSEQYLYVMDSSGVVYKFTLSTPGDITTASYDSESFASGLSNPKELLVTQEKLFISTYGTDGFVNAYDLDILSDSRATRSIARFTAWSLYDTFQDADLIDWTNLDTLDTLWESRGDYLDMEYVDETTVWEAAKVMLAPGYAEPTIKEGKFLPVRISSGEDYSHLYTPDVMLDEGLQVDHVHYDPQEPDGIDIEYFSLTTYENEVVRCLASGDSGTNPKRIEVKGITDETKAWRYGMRERNRMRYKPAVYTFRTEMDALNSEYGDAVGLASEIFASQCGEVTAYSAPSMTVDFTPSFGAGTHYAALRNREGEFSGLHTVTQGSPNNTMTITSSPLLDFTPVTDGSMDSTLVSFGDSDSWGKRAIIRSIQPDTDNTVNVTAEEYVSNVYADDDNSPPS